MQRAGGWSSTPPEADWGETDSGAGKETQLVTGAPDVHTSGDGGGNLKRHRALKSSPDQGIFKQKKTKRVFLLLKNTGCSFICLIVPSHEEEDFLSNAADK